MDRKQAIGTKLAEILPAGAVRADEPMGKYTSFRIGGPVEVMAFPKTVDALRELLQVSVLLDCNFDRLKVEDYQD